MDKLGEEKTPAPSHRQHCEEGGIPLRRGASELLYEPARDIVKAKVLTKSLRDPAFIEIIFYIKAADVDGASLY